MSKGSRATGEVGHSITAVRFTRGFYTGGLTSEDSAVKGEASTARKRRDYIQDAQRQSARRKEQGLGLNWQKAPEELSLQVSGRPHASE